MITQTRVQVHDLTGSASKEAQQQVETILADRRLLFAEEIMRPVEESGAVVPGARVEVQRINRLQPRAVVELIVDPDQGSDAAMVIGALERKTGSTASRRIGPAARGPHRAPVVGSALFPFRGWQSTDIVLDQSLPGTQLEPLQFSFTRVGPPIMSWGPTNRKELLRLRSGAQISLETAFSSSAFTQALSPRQMNIESRFAYIAASLGGNLEYCCAQTLMSVAERPHRVVELLASFNNPIARRQTYALWSLLCDLYELRRGVPPQAF